MKMELKQSILNKDDFRKFIENDIRFITKVDLDIHLVDQRNQIYSYETDGDVLRRIVSDPYYASDKRTGNLIKDIMWSIAWEKDEESDHEIDPWDIPEFPIIIYENIEECFKHNPL